MNRTRDPLRPLFFPSGAPARPLPGAGHGLPRPLTQGPWLALLLALALLATPALAAPPKASDLGKAEADLSALSRDKARASQHSSWDELRERVERLATGRDEAKALFLLGRIAEETGRWSGAKTDYVQACDYYQRFVTRYPRDPQADDALMRKARIYLDKLDDRAQAYTDLLMVSHYYPRSENVPQARAMLKQLDRARLADDPRPPPQPQEAQLSQQAQQAKEAQQPQSAQQTPPPKPRKADLAELVTIRYRSSPDYSRIVFEMDREVAYVHQRSKAETGQQRLTFDLRGSAVGREVRQDIKVSHGILGAVRTSQDKEDQVRVVLDLRSADEVKVFSLNNPFRIVVDVHSSDKGPSLAATPEPRPKTQDRPSQEPAQEPAQAAGKVAGDYRTPAGTKRIAGSLVEQLGLSIRKIMIDPGHGGKDPGAIAWGLYEKDINLHVGRLLAEELRSRGYEVALTRTTDVYIPLEDRTAMANEQKADMFISVHCNAHNDPRVHGVETFSLNLAKTEDAIRVAARENSISGKQISDLQFILTDLMLNSKMKESGDLAGHVQTQIVSHLRKRYSLRSHGTKEAPFYVLMGAKMPAVLAEIGYLTNIQEARRLADDAYQRELAQGLANGIEAYRRQIERFASLGTARTSSSF